MNSVCIMKLLVFVLLVSAACAKRARVRRAIGDLEETSDRVVGGHDATPHQFPWQVTLQLPGRKHNCGAAIIDNNWLLTAAHCIPGFTGYTAVAGKQDLSKIEPTEQSSLFKRTIVNEMFGGGVGPNDIALIELATPFNYTAEVQAVQLPTIKDENYSGQATVSGWGSTSNTSTPKYPNILQTADETIITIEKCKQHSDGSSSVVDNGNVCTETPGINACSGDSGGPLVQYSGTEATLIGLVSWGTVPCGQPNKPSVYTKVSAFLDWIKANKK